MEEMQSDYGRLGVFDVWNALTRVKEFDELLLCALALARHHVPSQTAAIYLYGKNGALERKKILGVDHGGAEIPNEWFLEESVAPGTSFTGRVVIPSGDGCFGAPAYSNNITQQQVSPKSWTAYTEKLGGLRSMIAVPLNGRNRSFGVLEVVNRLNSDDNSTLHPIYTSDDVHRLLIIGVALASAVTRFRLGEEQNFLNDLSSRVLDAIAENTTGAAYYQDITDRLVDPTTAYKACILRIGPSVTHLETVATAGDVNWDGFPTDRDHSKGQLARVFRERKPVALSNLEEKQEDFQTWEWIGKNQLKAYAGIPVLRGEVVLGALSLFTSYPHQFSDDSLIFLQNIANLIGSYREIRFLNEENTRIRMDTYKYAQNMLGGVERLWVNREERMKTKLHKIKVSLEYVAADLGSLEQRIGPPEALELSRIRAAADGIVATVKASLGDLVEHSTDVQVNDTVRTVVQFFQNLFPRGRVVFGLQLGDLPTIEADEAEIAEILQNLLFNAVRSIESAGRLGAINITTDLTGVGGRKEIRIQVQDNGVGIPTAIRGKIFNRAYTTNKGGTGMGLYICRNLLRKYKGTISIAYAPLGSGATFEVRIPASRARRTK